MWHQVQIGKQNRELREIITATLKKKTENINDKWLKIQGFRLDLTRRLSLNVNVLTGQHPTHHQPPHKKRRQTGL